MACLFRRNSSKIWWMRYQRDGVRVAKSTRTTSRRKARRALDEAVTQPTLPVQAQTQRVRFQTLCEDYAREHLPLLSPATQMNYRGHIKVFLKLFPKHRVDGFSKLDVGCLASTLRVRGLKPCTVRRYLTTLSSIWAFGERYGWVSMNQLPHIDKKSLPEAKPRVRFLTQEEYQRLHAAAPPHLRPIIELAVSTGMRQAELYGLKWEDVDLARREARLERTKNNLPRQVPLGDSAVATLATIERRGPYVFTNPDTGTRYVDTWQSFNRACQTAVITNMRFHDLRHTYASWAVQHGMDLYTLSRILGHSSVKMTSRYAHLTTAELHKAVRANDEAMKASKATRLQQQAASEGRDAMMRGYRPPSTSELARAAARLAESVRLANAVSGAGRTAK